MHQYQFNSAITAGLLTALQDVSEVLWSRCFFSRRRSDCPAFFFFFSPIGAPRGKCLWKPAVMPRHCLIHFSQDMLFKSICSLGVGGGLKDVVLLMHRLLMPECIPDHQGRAWTLFFLNVHTDVRGIFSPQSVLPPICQIIHSSTSTWPTNVNIQHIGLSPWGHGQTDGRWW